MNWTGWQEKYGVKIQERMRAILKAEGLEDSYTLLDLQMLSDILSCGLSSYHNSVARQALRAANAFRQ